MKALIFDGPRRMSIADIGASRAQDGEAVVNVLAAGVCGSEMHSFLGHSTYRPAGTIFGHELVVAAGPGLARRWVVDALLTCGHCQQCTEGRSNVCENRRLLGAEVPGGFAEMVALPEGNLLGLPDEVPDDVGVMAEPLANAVPVERKLGSLVGRPLAIVGCGPIGLSCMVVAPISGASLITMWDPVPARRQLAADLGATVAAGEVELYSNLHESAKQFDLIVDAVGAASTRTAAVERAAPGAKVVLLGLHDQACEVAVNLAIRKELRISASFAYVRADFVAAIGILRRVREGLRRLISVHPLERGRAAMEALADQPDRNFKVLLRPTFNRAAS